MEPIQCKSCGQVIREWAQFCPACAEPLEGYARPAGFWIRVGAQIVDSLVFIPFGALGFWALYFRKDMALTILTTLPQFFYKPMMESFLGATLGKMACGIKVVDEAGRRLSLFRAYTRALPFLAAAGFGLAYEVLRLSTPEFQAAQSWIETAQVKPPSFLTRVNQLVALFVIVDCVFVAFTFRKRALHDMLAESYVVYKEP